MIEKQKSMLDPYSFLAPPSPTFYSPSQNPLDYFFPKASPSWSLPIASAYKKKTEPPKKKPTKLNISSQESVESPTKLENTLKKDTHDFQDSQDPYSQLSTREKPETLKKSNETGMNLKNNLNNLQQKQKSITQRKWKSITEW